MTRHVWRGAGHLAPLIFLALLLCLSLPTPAQAQGLGWSGGSFDGQHFYLLRGETTPEDANIYIIVRNAGDSPITVEITTPATPLQVEILLPTRNLTLEPGESQKLNVTITVGQEATPGDYTLTVAGEIVPTGQGIAVVAGGQSRATLTILGEAGTVVIRAVDPEGEPFPATIGVYKEIAGELSLVYPLQRSSLETKLAPGNYLARAYYENITVTEEEFSLAADERKEIDLVCYSPCLTKFTLSPVYSAEGVLVSARITYGIANLLQPVDNFTVLLKVSVDNRASDSAELLSRPTLGVGETASGVDSYSPAEGWQKGRTYRFVIEFQVGGELYYQSPAKALTPAGMPGGVNWAIIGGIIAAVVVVAVVVYLVRRPRTKKA